MSDFPLLLLSYVTGSHLPITMEHRIVAYPTTMLLTRPSFISLLFIYAYDLTLIGGTGSLNVSVAATIVMSTYCDKQQQQQQQHG